MAEIRPFGGIRYRVSDAELSRVLAPPYDVIGEAYAEALRRRDPRNVVRLILSRGKEEADYAEVGATYRRWLASGTLAPDPEPGLYLLEQRYLAVALAIWTASVWASRSISDARSSAKRH